MISIREYLNAEQKNPAGGAASHFAEDLCRLPSGILDCISQFVLTGDADESPQSRLLQVKESLRPDLKPDEAARAAESVCSSSTPNPPVRVRRWTPSSLIAVFSRPRNADKPRSEVSNLNRTPLVRLRFSAQDGPWGKNRGSDIIAFPSGCGKPFRPPFRADRAG